MEHREGVHGVVLEMTWVVDMVLVVCEPVVSQQEAFLEAWEKGKGNRDKQEH